MRHSHLGQTLLSPTAAPPLAPLIPRTGLLAWWDAESGVFSDTGLTTPITNGGSVAGWRDRGSSGYHVTQSTAGDRPVYRASVAALNSKPAIEFVSSDVLTRTGLSGAIVANLATHSVYVVFASTTAAAMTFYSEGSSSSTTPFATFNMGTNVSFSYRGDTSTIASATGGTNANNGAAHIYTLRRIAADSWSLRLDGTQVGTSAVNHGTTTINQLGIGAFFRTTTTQYLTGFIAQILLYSSDNFATVEPILRGYYGA